MYIFEILLKKFLKKKNVVNDDENLEDDGECRHVFLPVDSTGDFLACNNCGFVIKNDKNPKIKDENFFKF